MRSKGTIFNKRRIVLFLVLLCVNVKHARSSKAARYLSKFTLRLSSSIKYRGGLIQRNIFPPSGSVGNNLQSRFLKLNAKYPLQTAIGASGVIWFIGDIIAQAIERRSIDKPLNHARLIGTTVEESLVGGGVGCLWYKFLDQFVVRRLGCIPGTPRFVLAKLGLEFLVWQPVSLVAFWTIVGLAEGHSASQIRRELRSDFLPTLLGECCLWLPIDLLNFSRVPVGCQVRHAQPKSPASGATPARPSPGGPPQAARADNLPRQRARCGPAPARGRRPGGRPLPVSPANDGARFDDAVSF